MRTTVGGQKCQHLVHTGHSRGPPEQIGADIVGTTLALPGGAGTSGRLSAWAWISHDPGTPRADRCHDRRRSDVRVRVLGVDSSARTAAADATADLRYLP